jgi:hypothetical protein
MTTERKLRKHRELLLESVRQHVLPAIIQQGFTVAPHRVQQGPVDRKSVGIYPFEQMQRARPDGGVDLVGIQFMTYQRAAFRINACAVPKQGMMTAGGHKTTEECIALGVHDLETHARPWLRPFLKALRLEPLGAWFSLPFWWFRSPKQTDYDKLALRVVGLLPEVDAALREGELGPHMRRMVMKPLPPEIIERLKKFEAERALEK